MEEYEVEVSISGRTFYYVLADNAHDAENSARKKLRRDLASIVVDCVADSFSATLVNDGNTKTCPTTPCPDHDDQLEEEDQWNGPKR